MPRLLAVLALALALLPTLPKSGPAATVPEARSIYRITPGKTVDLKPLFRLGLDLAGHGPGQSLDFVLTAADVDRVRSLGFTPVPVERRGGPLGAPTTPFAKPNLGDYHTYSEAVAAMTAAVAAHPAIARLDTIGVSLQGRPIPAIKISDQAALDESEAEVLVVGCHHARELMSVELPLDVMRRLLDGYGVDPVLTGLVDTREIWIVPVVNPDGYVFVENNANGQSGTWWRKNRRPNGDGSIGVDLNRNYGFAWGYDDAGSSPVPASETYRGAAAFSEPETAALRDFVLSRQFTVSASFHSYGALVLYPWGYDRIDTSDHGVLSALADSIVAQNGYRSGNPKSNAIYLTNGDLDDWIYGGSSPAPPVLPFTFELNTAEQGGFDPPEALIGATCDQNWGPVLTLLRYADQPRRALGPPRPVNLHIMPSGGVPVLAWSYPVLDPANVSARHDVRRIGQALRVFDDAEAGAADWDTLRFSWSTARAASGARSYYSGSADSRESILLSRASMDTPSGDSVVVRAWWALEADFDYWYAQASIDGGSTWTSLAGTHTTNLNPFGQNEGFGVTGSSGGAFVRTAFSLLPFVGKQVLLRFRCVTDAVTHGEGLYLDDLAPVPRYQDVLVQDTGSPDSSFAVHPPPTTPTWLQTRGIDSEGQPSRWSDRLLFDPAVSAVVVEASARRDAIAGIVPNPMNPRAEVRFTLAAGAATPYRLDGFDAGGRWVACLAAGRSDGRGGVWSVPWNGRDASGRELPSGVYFLRLLHGSSRQTAKVTLLR